ncbi:lytic transglycosylase domain-containing protein [Hydrogenimonas sp.]
MRRGALFFLLLLPALLGAGEITLEWLAQKPRSYAKDFYIWRYFGQNITPEQADAAFYQIRSVNWKLIRRYAKKTKMPGFAMADRCHRLGAKKLPAESAECSAIALTPYKFAHMSRKKRFELMKQLADYPNLLRWMETMVDETPFFALVKSGPDTFLELFNRCGRQWRAEHLDHPLPPLLVAELSKKSGFAQTIKLIATDPNLPNLRRSLLGIDSAKLNHRATFFLAMNAVNLGHPALAKIYLADAYKKAWFRFDKDKVLFWFYLLEPKEETLKQLAQSFDLNLYTLYAHEELGTKWPRVVSPSFEKEGCGYDIEDPFAWLKVLGAIKGKKEAWLLDYSRRFACRETEGHYSFVMERAARWRTHYFPLPYDKAFEGLSADEKALLLSLARQESRFIPSSISPSYALGMMQIMPFLVKALAKERKEPFDLDAMFDPYTNVAYARQHMKFLKRSLYHPLFIAYAYNGGIGFTKKMLTTRGLFEKGEYEPWLSMELVHYDESRRYGKKVLANYIVYKKLLGEPIAVSKAVETLTRPSRTDRFRSR